ncbi:hypothetical protein D3C73_1103020 [compost metagenome]
MAFRFGRLGQASASAIPASNTPHRNRPTQKMPVFTKNRRIGEPLLAGLSFLEEFWGLLIAAILRVSPVPSQREGSVSVTRLFCVVRGQLAADVIMPE